MQVGSEEGRAGRIITPFEYRHQLQSSNDGSTDTTADNLLIDGAMRQAGGHSSGTVSRYIAEPEKIAIYQVLELSCPGMLKAPQHNFAGTSCSSSHFPGAREGIRRRVAYRRTDAICTLEVDRYRPIHVLLVIIDSVILTIAGS
jgi:hypothetical protein